MDRPETHELIIIRRHEEEEHETHNTAWKVAHADFMTAMMAFFLIMWLINSTDADIKKSIANYFNPVQLSESVTNRKGLNDPKATAADGPDGEGDERSTLKKPGAGEAHASEPQPHDEPAPEGLEADAAAAGEAAAAKERAAFQDPYAILAKLATEAEQSAATPLGAAAAGTGASGEAYRDPFDPVYWQMVSSARAGTDEAGAPEPTQAAVAVSAEAADVPSGEPPADAGQQLPLTGARSDVHTTEADFSAKPATTPVGSEMAESLKAELGKALEATLGTSRAPKLDVQATNEGLLVSLTDDIDFSMFEIGSAVPNPQVVLAMEQVAAALAQRSGGIVIRGYTDGRPFRSDTYDNWRLSSARAHMAYYMLTRGGLDEERVRRIEGHADRELKNADNPNAAENRRIEILLTEPVT